ncbi:466_t:CDS:1, partial [Entrophospora sp. SA101]
MYTLEDAKQVAYNRNGTAFQPNIKIVMHGVSIAQNINVKIYA